MPPDQRRGQRASNLPSVAGIDRRAEDPPRQRHPVDIDRNRVQQGQIQWLPQQHGFQHRGDHLMLNDPNPYRDDQRRFQPSVTGRASDRISRISTPSLHNHHGTPTHAQHVDPQFPWSHFTGPRYPDLRYPGPRYPDLRYPGPQYPGPQYPGRQYPGPPPAMSQQVRGRDSAYRPNIDEYGTPQATNYFPPLQEVFGRLPPTFNNQTFAGPSEPQAGIPTSMGAFDNTSFQQGYNDPYFLPDLGYGGSSHGQGASPDPFRSLLSTPYLLPAPLLGTPTLQPTLSQNTPQFPPQVLPALATTHEQTRSGVASIQGGNLYDNQTTVDPQDLTIIPHNLQGQGSEKRKRRDNSSPEDGSSPSPSAHETNPEVDARLHSGPQQENHNPTRAQSVEHQDDIGAAVDPETRNAATETVGKGQQKPYPCEICGKRYGSSKSRQGHYRQYCKRDEKRRHKRQTLNPPEAESELVMTDHEPPAEVIDQVPSESVPQDNQSGNENGEQQLVDDAQNPSPLIQDSGPPSTPPERVPAKKQRAIQSPFFIELDLYNGVVTPSKLEPGEAPRVPSWSKGQQPLKVGAECPICGVRFARNGNLQQHFLACAKKNGNPNGSHWDELLEDQ